MKTVYVSIVGNRDPYDLVRTQSGDGAALSLFKSLSVQEGFRFQEALLIYTPDAEAKVGEPTYTERLDLLTDELKALHPDLAVKALPIYGPPNRSEVFQELIRVLRPHLAAGETWHVNASSGTPAMLTSLQILNASQWFSPAQVQLWQSVDPSHLSSEAGPQDYYFKSKMPLFAEALKLHEAFSALKRFDFAHAQDVLGSLTNLEISERSEKIPPLKCLATALLHLEHKDFAEALRWMQKAEQDIPLQEVKDLRVLLQQLQARKPEALATETWTRIDRLVQNHDVLGAITWTQSYAEQITQLILAKQGILGDKLRRETFPERFKELCEAMGSVEQKLYLDIHYHNTKIKLLRALNAIPLEQADLLDTQTHPDLNYLQGIRNKIIHKGEKATPEDLQTVQKVARVLLNVYPHPKPIQQPEKLPLSAQSIQSLAQHLQEWLG